MIAANDVSPLIRRYDELRHSFMSIVLPNEHEQKKKKKKKKKNEKEDRVVNDGDKNIEIRNNLRYLMEAYRVASDDDETISGSSFFSLERPFSEERLILTLQTITRRIISATTTTTTITPSSSSSSNKYNNNNNKTTTTTTTPELELHHHHHDQHQQQDDHHRQEQQLHHHHRQQQPNPQHDIPLVIRMWLNIYDETALEQAWTLLMHYLQLPTIITTPPSSLSSSSTSMTTSSVLSSSTASSSSSASSSSASSSSSLPSHHHHHHPHHHPDLPRLTPKQEILIRFFFNWNARWIARQDAHWQTPEQMWNRLQHLVMLFNHRTNKNNYVERENESRNNNNNNDANDTNSTIMPRRANDDDDDKNENEECFQVPLPVFHALLKAIARGLILEQEKHHDKGQGNDNNILQKQKAFAPKQNQDRKNIHSSTYGRTASSSSSSLSTTSSSSSLSSSSSSSAQLAVNLAEDILRFLQHVSSSPTPSSLSSSSSSSTFAAATTSAAAATTAAPARVYCPWLAPTLVTYNIVMATLARSQLPHAPARVEEFLQFLHQQQKQQQQQQQKQQQQQQQQLQTTMEDMRSNNMDNKDSSNNEINSSNNNNNNNNNNYNQYFYFGPTTESYRAAITAWAHVSAHEPQAAERAWMLLREMIDHYYYHVNDVAASHHHHHITETNIMFDEHYDDETTGVTLDGGSDPSFIGGRTSSLPLSSSSSMIIIKPMGDCFALVIWAFAQQGNVLQAQAVFQQQYELFQTTGDADFCPTVFGLNALIQAWAAEAGGGSARVVTNDNNHHYTTTNPQPTTTTTTNSVSVPGIMAEQLISQMEVLAELAGDETLLPNIHTYRTALMVWVKSCKSAVVPDQVGASSMTSLSSLPLLDAPTRAEAMLRRMEFYYLNGLLDETPGVASYGMVVDAWCKAGEPERAEALLRNLHDQWQELGLPDLKPTRIHYHMVLNAWGNALTKTNNVTATGAAATAVATAYAAEAPQRATRLLEEMKRSGDADLEPDSVTYFLLLNIWAKSKTKEGKVMVQALLKEMGEIGKKLRNESRHKGGLKPSTLHYNTMLNGLANAGDAEAAEAILRKAKNINGSGEIEFEPDIYTYNTVLQAWSKSRRPDSPDRAQALFDELIELYEKDRDDRWKPTVETFTTLMTIHGNSKRPNSADRALALFNDMKARYQAGAKHLRPDVIHCTALLTAWSKVGQAEYAEALLDQMIRSADGLTHGAAAGIDENAIVVIPNAHSFASVIAGWARSNDPRAGVRAESILRRMKQLSTVNSNQQRPPFPCRPDTVSFNSTLQAWATSLRYCSNRPSGHRRRRGRDSDFTAEMILRRMELLLTEMMEHSVASGDSSVAPDRISFILYLSALQRLSPNAIVDRAERAHRVFDWMQQLGLSRDADLVKMMERCTSQGN